jgi:hypothetical protein
MGAAVFLTNCGAMGGDAPLINRRRYARLLAPWVAVAWLLAWTALLVQPCCEVFAAPVYGHGHQSAHMHGDHENCQHQSVPAPCGHLLSGDPDSGLLPKEASFGHSSLDVVPAYSTQVLVHKPYGELRFAFWSDSSPSNSAAVFLTTQRFRI